MLARPRFRLSCGLPSVVFLAVPLFVPRFGSTSGCSIGAALYREYFQRAPCRVRLDGGTTSLVGSMPLTATLLDEYVAFKRALPVFWSAHQELLSKAQASRRDSTVSVFDVDGTLQTKQIGVFDYVGLTTQDSALAALFARYHFRPDQFAATQVAIYQALYALVASDLAAPQQVSGMPDTASVEGHNMALVRTRRLALARVGVAVWPPLTSGHQAPALDVDRWLNMASAHSRPALGDGHVYVINFTAHWCGPCRQVYPVLAQLPAIYARRGVRVFYVTQLFGFYGEQEDVVPQVETDSLLKYIHQHDFVGPVALVPDLSMSGYGPPEKRFKYPLVVVVDGHGILRAAFEGWSDELSANVRAAIDRTLAGGPRQ